MGKRREEQMEKDDLYFDGYVTSMPGGGFYIVKVVDPCLDVLAKLSGRLKQYKIRIIAGDYVRVEVSPYDLTRGRITFRYDSKHKPNETTT